jgi:hypothetical protein
MVAGSGWPVLRLWHRGGGATPCWVTPTTMHLGRLVRQLVTAGQVALFVQQVGVAPRESFW